MKEIMRPLTGIWDRCTSSKMNMVCSNQYPLLTNNWHETEAVSAEYTYKSTEVNHATCSGLQTLEQCHHVIPALMLALQLQSKRCCRPKGGSLRDRTLKQIRAPQLYCS